MLKGWVGSGVMRPDEIAVTDRDRPRAKALASEYGAVEAADAGEAAGAATVVLAVKPQDSGGALEEIAGGLTAGKTLVSIVAGLTVATMRGKVGGAPTIVRVMPNMGALAGASVSAYCIARGEGGFDPAEVVGMLEAIGPATEVEESELDLVTAVSGSGPAYFFLLTEALERAAVDGGMDPSTARLLAEGTLWGAAKVLMESGRGAGDLREAVSSPGGTTLAALGVMRDEGFTELISRAVEAARKRAGELAS